MSQLPLGQQRTIDQFAKIAEEYCRLVGEYASMKASDFLISIESHLPSLYLGALALPDVEPSQDEGESTADAVQWNKLYTGLTTFLGEYDVYHAVFDPADGKDYESITATLSDDLAEIHGDLVDGLTYWRSASATGKTDAAWEWK